MPQKIYPRSKDKETVYLKGVISNPNIIIGDYTMEGVKFSVSMGKNLF